MEYIQQLQRLKKWRKPSSNLKVGDLVLLKEDHTYTQQWPMARVTDVHPGWAGTDCHHTNRNLNLQTSSCQTGVAPQPGRSRCCLLSEPRSRASSRRRSRAKTITLSFMSSSSPPPSMFRRNAVHLN